LTDYPTQALSSGRVIGGGEEGEYYLYLVGEYGEDGSASDWVPKVLSKPPTRSKGAHVKDRIPVEHGAIVSFPKILGQGKGSFAGYFSRIDGDPRFDFNRSTCDDPRQVYHALGIEPARMVMFENLYHLLTNSDADVRDYGVQSAGLELHPMHISLLIDSLCYGISLKTIAGQSSIYGGSGAVAQKGSFSTKVGDEWSHYSDVLAIASYESPHRVLLGPANGGLFPAAMGVIDRINSPTTIQIVGGVDHLAVRPNPKVSLAHLHPLIFDLRDVKNRKDSVLREINEICIEEKGATWYMIQQLKGWDGFSDTQNREGTLSAYNDIITMPRIIELREVFAELIVEEDEIRSRLPAF